MQSWLERLEKNDTEMYSTHNEGKSIITERFKRKGMIKTWLWDQKMCMQPSKFRWKVCW